MLDIVEDVRDLRQAHSLRTFLQVLQHPGQESASLPQTLQQLQACWDPLHALQQLHELLILDPPQPMQQVQLWQQVQASRPSRDSFPRQVLQRFLVPEHLQFLVGRLQALHLVIIGCSWWGPLTLPGERLDSQDYRQRRCWARLVATLTTMSQS